MCRDKVVRSAAGVGRAGKWQARTSAHGEDWPDLRERREQFESLALPLTDTLYAAGLLILERPAWAEELVMETFLRAWQDFRCFTTAADFKGQVFRIMALICQDEPHRTRAHAVTLECFTHNQPPDGLPSERTMAYANGPLRQTPPLRQTHGRLASTIGRLDQGQRLLLALEALGGLSPQECAEAARIPTMAVFQYGSPAGFPENDP